MYDEKSSCSEALPVRYSQPSPRPAAVLTIPLPAVALATLTKAKEPEDSTSIPNHRTLERTEE